MDVYDARWTIIGGIMLAVLTTFGYIKFMDWCAYYMAWFSVVLLGLFFVGGGFGVWFVRKSLLDDGNESNDEYADHLFWAAIVFWLVAVAYVIFVACCWSSLKVSIAIIETAADFFADTKRIVLVPLCYFGVAVVIFGIWVGAIIFVNSIGDITVESVAT